MVCRYRRCAEADHIRRQVEQHAAEEAVLADQRRVIEQVMRCKEQGLDIPEELLPKKKAEKKADAGKDGKDAKKKK